MAIASSSADIAGFPRNSRRGRVSGWYRYQAAVSHRAVEHLSKTELARLGKASGARARRSSHAEFRAAVNRTVSFLASALAIKALVGTVDRIFGINT